MPVEVVGDEEAMQATGELSKDYWKDDELCEWADSTRLVLEQMPYPPELPGQRYVRTERFGKSYRVNRPRKMVRVITNRASTRQGFYGGYVAGQKQATVHRGRWYKVGDVVEDELPALYKRIGKRGVKVFEVT